MSYNLIFNTEFVFPRHNTVNLNKTNSCRSAKAMYDK